MIADVVAAVLCVSGALIALQSREMMRSVLGLALFFLGLSCFFGLLGAWFLAVGQIFLFIGGVVTLFVLAFSFTPTVPYQSRTLSGVLVGGAVLAVLLLFVALDIRPTSVPLQEFASLLFREYGVVINVAILLLFSAVMTAQYVMTEEPQ